MRKRLLALGLLLAVSFSASGGRLQRRCDQFFPPQLRELPFDALTNANTSAWIADSLGFRGDRAWGDAESGQAWIWSDGLGRKIFQTLRPPYGLHPTDPPPAQLEIDYLQSEQPTVDDVVRCLSAPEYYEARNAPPSLRIFSMLYPSKGIALKAIYDWSGPPFPVTGGTKLGSLWVMRPGTLTEMARGLYQGLDFRDEGEVSAFGMRPWPKKLSDIAPMQSTRR